MLSACLLLGLVLSTPDAAAANTPKIKNIRIRQTSNTSNGSYRIVITVQDDDDADVDSVRVSVDGDDKTSADLDDVLLPLTGELSALPEDSAELSLSLTDAVGDEVATLTGTLDADGSIALSLPSGGDGDGGDCGGRTGCGDGSRPTTDTPDISARGSFVVDGDEGYSVSLVLSGADAALVAGATLSLAETVTGESECLRTDAVGTCIRWGTVSWTEEVDVDLDLGGLEWAWTAEAPADFALGDRVRAQLRDEAGDLLDQSNVRMAPPLDDGGAGVATVLVDRGAEATLSLLPLTDGSGALVYGLALFTSDWNAADATPQEGRLTLDDGTSTPLTPHSYQASAWIPLGFDGDPSGEVFALEQDGIAKGTFNSVAKCNVDLTTDLHACGVVEEDADGQWGLALTVYAGDPSALPATATLSLSATVGTVTTLDETYEADFGDGYAVVFAVPVDFTADPLGAEVGMDFELLGEAGRSGRQRTLASGSVAVVLDTNEDGSLVASTIDPDDITEYRGDILIIGEPIGIEREVGDEPVPTTPPVLQLRNGVGTRNVATANTAKPGLL